MKTYMLTVFADSKEGGNPCPVGVEGWFYGSVNVPMRVVAFAGSLMLIDSGMKTDLIGLACLAVVFVYQRFINKNRPVKC